MLYDGLLLLAIFFFTTLIIIMFNKGAAVEPGNLLYNLFLLFISYVYFVWHWIHAGQTLGMLAWKIKLTTTEGGTVSLRQATRRYLIAILSLATCGTGFLWTIFDRDRLTWHDRYSGTILKLVKQ